MKAVSYLRVSTDDQGLGLDAQRAMIAAYLCRGGVVAFVEHVDEGVSGGAPMDQRPGLLAALGSLVRGSVLVVAKRDRLARDPFVAMMAERMAERRGARVVCADGNGNGDGAADVLMRRMLDAFAEFERAQIVMRTRAAMGAARLRGAKLSSSRPYGWRIEGSRLVEDEEEQRVRSLIVSMASSGPTRIAAELNGRGLMRESGAWTKQAVSRVLRRERLLLGRAAS